MATFLTITFMVLFVGAMAFSARSAPKQIALNPTPVVVSGCVVHIRGAGEATIAVISPVGFRYSFSGFPRVVGGDIVVPHFSKEIGTRNCVYRLHNTNTVHIAELEELLQLIVVMPQYTALKETS